MQHESTRQLLPREHTTRSPTRSPTALFDTGALPGVYGSTMKWYCHDTPDLIYKQQGTNLPPDKATTPSLICSDAAGMGSRQRQPCVKETWRARMQPTRCGGNTCCAAAWKSRAHQNQAPPRTHLLYRHTIETAGPQSGPGGMSRGPPLTHPS